MRGPSGWPDVPAYMPRMQRGTQAMRRSDSQGLFKRGSLRWLTFR
jgi:hypothetical protein